MQAIYIYYTAVNIFLFVLMGCDKLCARLDRRRIRERSLLMLSLLGGGLGGLAGMLLFRHKIRKHYFAVCFVLSVITHGIIIYNYVT